MKTIMTSAEAEMMSDALEESGLSCFTSETIAVISVARARPIKSAPMPYVAIFSILRCVVVNFMRDIYSAKCLPELAGAKGQAFLLARLRNLAEPPDDNTSRNDFYA